MKSVKWQISQGALSDTFAESLEFYGSSSQTEKESRGTGVDFFYFIEIVTDILARKLKYSKTKIRKLHEKQYKYVDQQEHFNDGYFQEWFAAVAEDDRE